MHLLISGVPGTGKSIFARWLVAERGYVRCPSGEEPGPSFLAEINEARREGADVVIDWGFPLVLLGKVRSLIASGVEPFWFDGDRDAALQAFLARDGHPAAKPAWDVQLRDIEENWEEIADTFAGRILDVVGPGPVHMVNEDRWDRIAKLALHS